MLHITRRTEGTFEKDPKIIASSTASPYTPIMVDLRRERYTSYDGKIIFYTYHRRKMNKVQHINPYDYDTSILYDSLTYRLEFRTMYTDDSKRAAIINVAKGCIYDSNFNILIMLSFKAGTSVNYNSNHISSATIENGRNLKLFISTDFVSNPLYNKVYKEIHENYLPQAFKLEIPVVITKSEEIEKLHYSNDFELKFNKVDDLQYHLSNVVGKIFGMKYHGFENFHPGIVEEREVILPITQEIHEETFVEEVITRIPEEEVMNSFQQSEQSHYIAGFDPASLDSIPVITHIFGDTGTVSYTEGQRVDWADTNGVIAEYRNTRLSAEEYFYLAYNPMIPVADASRIMIDNINLIDDTGDELFTNSGDTELAPF